ncbi:hypothetical protein chiPu_0024775 [Chiloscyllium punctatum]|uniref:Uncharacterized protein n=1 Tax=Chiloscyllium punctatum TaxID=137246 RepID=A0A401TE60_CHIPU|nr:hypothetical protein [Chiloscyllium punctatum]
MPPTPLRRIGPAVTRSVIRLAGARAMTRPPLNPIVLAVAAHINHWPSGVPFDWTTGRCLHLFLKGAGHGGKSGGRAAGLRVVRKGDRKNKTDSLTLIFISEFLESVEGLCKSRALGKAGYDHAESHAHQMHWNPLPRADPGDPVDVTYLEDLSGGSAEDRNPPPSVQTEPKTRFCICRRWSLQ